MRHALPANLAIKGRRLHTCPRYLGGAGGAAWCRTSTHPRERRQTGLGAHAVLLCTFAQPRLRSAVQGKHTCRIKPSTGSPPRRDAPARQSWTPSARDTTLLTILPVEEFCALLLLWWRLATGRSNDCPYRIPASAASKRGNYPHSSSLVDELRCIDITGMDCCASLPSG